MSKYNRLYLLDSSLGKSEQLASCEYKAIEEFKKKNPQAKKVKVIATMNAGDWNYKINTK